MPDFLNIAAYRFVPLADCPELQERLRQNAQSRGLKGTVLLAEEGINLFLAGVATEVEGFLADLCSDARFAGLTVKRSRSAELPFRKLLVKIKREIIRMDHPTIRPADGRAPAVDARTLSRWLDAGCDDEGRPVVMLDTRNGFEVDEGAFDNAIDWRLTRFSEFPAAVQQHRGDFAGKTVVSYCTGGIRCEKAAIYMREAGIEHVWQLEGGILQYFEDTGGRHYHGNCFVFDERRTLDDTLSAQPEGQHKLPE
ncbi:MAG: sulfurtransferase [Aquabacterium sp.]|jgi:UPF0176 protein|nr:MAG: sulfurtransferase [Aquabacterium sp.]